MDFLIFHTVSFCAIHPLRNVFTHTYGWPLAVGVRYHTTNRILLFPITAKGRWVNAEINYHFWPLFAPTLRFSLFVFSILRNCVMWPSKRFKGVTFTPFWFVRSQFFPFLITNDESAFILTMIEVECRFFPLVWLIFAVLLLLLLLLLLISWVWIAFTEASLSRILIWNSSFDLFVRLVLFSLSLLYSKAVEVQSTSSFFFIISFGQSQHHQIGCFWLIHIIWHSGAKITQRKCDEAMKCWIDFFFISLFQVTKNSRWKKRNWFESIFIWVWSRLCWFLIAVIHSNDFHTSMKRQFKHFLRV